MRMADDQTIAQMVHANFGYFKHCMDERLRKLWSYEMRYLGIPQTRVRPGMSNIVLPHAAEAVDTFVAEWMAAEFGPDGLNIDIVGRTLLDENQARAIRSMIKFQNYRRDAKERWRHAATSTAIYGYAVLKTCFTKDYQKLPVDKPITINIAGQPVILGYDRQVDDVLVYKGPEMTEIDVFDFFIHPAMMDINDPLPVIQRSYLTEEDLIDGMEGDYYDPDAAMKLLSKIVKRRKDGENAPAAASGWGFEGGDNDDYKEQRQRHVGMQGGVDSDGVLVYEQQGPYDINDDGYSENCVLLVGPDNTILRAEELPYYDGRKTYCIMEMFQRKGSFFPMGIIEKAEQPLHVSDSIMNHALTHMRKNLYPPTVIDGRVKDSELIGMPGGLVHIEDVDEGRSLDSYIKQLYPQNLSSDVFSLYEYQRESIYKATGTDDIRAGRVPSSKQTARAVMIANQNASNKAQALFEMTESTGIIPVCRKFHMINRQFIDRPYAIKVLGKDGLWWPENVSPEDIAADVDFISLGSTRELNRQSRIENLERVFGLIANTPFAQPLLTPLVIKLLEELKLDNIEELEQAMNAEMFKQQEYQQYLMSLGQYPAVSNRPSVPQGRQLPMLGQIPGEESQTQMQTQNYQNTA